MALDPNTVLRIDKARIEGLAPDEIHASLEAAGLDPDETFREYSLTPFADGRMRGNVNLGDPDEWQVRDEAEGS